VVPTFAVEWFSARSAPLVVWILCFRDVAFVNENGSATVPLIAIVTATFNRCGDIVSLLSQIALLDYPAERIQIIVVDNASTDGTAARVRQDFPAVQVIENSENLGTAIGFNVGLESALHFQPRPKYIWLLDSDVILEPASLAPLVAVMEQDPHIGVAGSAVYDPKDRERLVAAGLRIEMKSGQVTFVIPRPGDPQKIVDVDLIAACSLFARSEACLQVGLWDPQMRLYWGDTDWCVRFLRAGCRVVCHRDSRAWHRDWTDVDRGFFTPVYLHDHIRGTLLFLVRHSSLRSARRLILGSYLRAALEQLTMRLAFAGGYELAIKDFMQASFTGRDFETIVGSPVLPHLPAVVDAITSQIPTSRRLTITGTCPTQVKAEFENLLAERFVSIEWSEPSESPPARKKSLGLGEGIGQVLQLALGLLKYPFRKDLLVAPLSRPSLTNLIAARHTVFLDAQGRGLVYRNQILAGFGRVLLTLIRGMRIAYIELPRAVKGPPLQRAIHSVVLPISNPLPQSTALAIAADPTHVSRS
jgi:GT2 family glycosyltransferase